MNRLIFILIVLVCSTLTGRAQDASSRLLLPYLSFAWHNPGRDMSDRFYSNTAMGGGLTLITTQRWAYQLEGLHLFRDKVKQTDVLKPATDDNGQVIDGDGIYANVFLYERGWHFSARAGRYIPFGKNMNSGIIITAGAGLLQHKIKIYSPGNTAPHISGDYMKGYDRLSNGLSLSEFIGYMYKSENHLTCFFIGAEFIQGFTKCRRDINYNTMEKDNSKRTDLLSGIKAGWIIPVSSKK